MYLFLVLITYVFADCSYPNPDILWCKNIEYFTINSSNALFVDIEDSNVSYLPMFTRQNWPNIEILTLRNNTMLSCTDIVKQQIIENLYIDYDMCKSIKDNTITNEENIKKRIILMYVLVLIFIIVFSIQYYYYYYKYDNSI